MEENTCRRYASVLMRFEKGEPVPRWFLKHARDCESCAFFFSCRMGMMEATFTTPRTTTENCIGPGSFAPLLLSSALVMRWSGNLREDGPEINLELLLRLNVVSEGDAAEMAETIETLDHIKSCSFCENYRLQLTATMAPALTRCHAAIRRGEPVFVEFERSTKWTNAEELFGENLTTPRPN